MNNLKTISAVDILLSLNIGIFLLTFLAGISSISLSELLLVGNKNWLSMLGMSHSNPIYTVFTSNFMHAGVIHLSLNMLALKNMGDILESRLGFMYFLSSYLLLCFLVMLGSYFYYADATLPVVGASGAICGMLSMIATLAFKQNKVLESFHNRNRLLSSVMAIYFLFHLTPSLFLW